MTPNVDRAGRSPLRYAALGGQAADVDAYLREHGDDVNLADKAGFTPLHFAAQGQHAEVAALLIAAGADPHARNQFGNTALLVALVNVRDKDGQVVRVLSFDRGATNRITCHARQVIRQQICVACPPTDARQGPTQT